MKIIYKDYPLQKHKNVIGCYSSFSKTCTIKDSLKGMEKYNTIIHEFGHFLIDIFGITQLNKHYLNFYYDILCIKLFKCNDIEIINWYIEYYTNARLKNKYVY